jgi:hypothetical protein
MKQKVFVGLGEKKRKKRGNCSATKDVLFFFLPRDDGSL